MQQSLSLFKVIDGVFLLHSTVLGGLIDKLVFVTASRRLADARRIFREKARWRKRYLSESHPDSFVRLFKVAFQRYVRVYHPRKQADLVISLD